MPSRSLRYERTAFRDLARLPADQRRAVEAMLTQLAAGTAPNLDVKKLVDVAPPRYRLRIGRYRAIFAFQPGLIVIERILDRRDAYR